MIHLTDDSVPPSAPGLTGLSATALEAAPPDEETSGGDGVAHEGNSRVPWRVVQLRARDMGLETVDLSGLSVATDVRQLVPQAWAERCRLIPLARVGRRLRVAVADPHQLEGVDHLHHLLRGEFEIEVRVARAGDIARAFTEAYGDGGGTNEPAAVAKDNQGEGAGADDGSVAESDAPVIQLVHDVILEALRRRASDVHLEPLEKRFRVRYRVDGVLVEAANPPKQLQLPIISRLKIMANISIAEKRIPQDGRIQITLGGRSWDLRVSSLPTAHGESVVMRILDRADLRPGLSELGLWAGDQARFEQLVGLPNGLILITGPTGSGKTTTLYSCLHQVNKSDRKIVTVEDPVEYQMTGINQVPVRHEFGVTFSSALRAMLRQAPNVIMVGEIRDRETADIAINAALTGHMVFSTLHTNDAIGAVARLVDLGVKPFLLSAALRAVVAQRLVRKICVHCRQTHVPTGVELGQVGLGNDPAASGTFMRGAGCPQCDGTGYRGRMGIFELLVLDEEISQMIHEGCGSSLLRAKARAKGMRTLREDGARKAIAGLTTIEEVVSITVGDTS